MEEEIDETMSSLDENDEEESEEQKEEERIDHPCPPSNESKSSTRDRPVQTLSVEVLPC